MKYNISNLDKFKNAEIAINPLISDADIQNNLTKAISNFEKGILEEKLEELIKPYVDVKKFGLELSKGILEYKNIELKCMESGEYTRYLVRNKITKEEDFFLVQNEINIKQEGGKYMINNYISEIVRGISN